MPLQQQQQKSRFDLIFRLRSENIDNWQTEKSIFDMKKLFIEAINRSDVS